MAKKDKKEKKGAGAAAVVATLQRQQANALVAYLNYKKYHWLSYGPLFRDIHLLLDEQATQTYASIDEFAERAIMIGGAPIGDPADYLPGREREALEGGPRMREMLAEARAARSTSSSRRCTRTPRSRRTPATSAPPTSTRGSSRCTRRTAGSSTRSSRSATD